MKKTLISLVAGLAVLGGVLLPSKVAWAEEASAESRSALEVTPSGAKLTLTAGETLEGNAANCPVGADGCAINVKNIGTGRVRFRVYMTPYVVKGEENELSFADDDNSPRAQLVKWVTVQNTDGEYVTETEFAAEPGETVKIPYRVVVPEEMLAGSQYAVIWAQIINDGTSGGIETVGQVGAVLSARSSEGILETAEISEYDFTKFTFGGALHASATVTNTGNVDFPINYTYTAKTLFGKELYKKEDFTATYFASGTVRSKRIARSLSPFWKR